MPLIITPYVIASALAAAVAFLVALITWQRRSVPGGKELTALIFTCGIWSAGAALEYAAVSVEDKFFWLKLSYLGVLSCPIFFFLFGLKHNRMDRWLTRRNIALLFLVPAITQILAFTNEQHGLIWSSIELNNDGTNLAVYGHGLAFWLGVIGYAYIFMVAGTILFLRAAIRLPDLKRHQTILIIVAALAPWVANLIYVSGLSPVPGLELTPLVLVLSGTLFALDILGFGLLDLTQVAQRTLTQTMLEGMVVLDVQGVVVDINPSAQQMLGVDEHTAIGQHVHNIFPTKLNWETLAHSQRAEDVEIELNEAESIYISLSVTPMRDQRGRCTGRLLVLHDITARRRAEIALRRRNDYLQALQQTGVELVLQLDLPSLLENIVRRAGQLVGTDSGYLDLVEHGTNLLKPQVGIGALAESLQHPVPLGEGVSGVVWQTGQPLVVNDYDSWAGRIGAFSKNKLRSVVGVPLLLGTEILGVLGVAHPAGSDRTFSDEEVEMLVQLAHLAVIAIENARLYAAVERERHYFELLLRNMPTAAALMDTEGKIALLNPAAEALFGYSQAEVMGQRADDLFATAPEMQAEAQDFTRRTFAQGQVHAITRRTRRGGSPVDVELRAVPIVMYGQTVGALAIYHDITELQQARQSAEAAAQAKSEFLAQMSHELRTPLNGILGYAQILQRRPELDDDMREGLAIIQRSGEHLLTLINDVLDLAKIDAHKMELFPDDVHLPTLLNGVTDLMRIRAEQKGLDFVLHFDNSLPQGVRVDEKRLRQVLLNLLGNAIKFTQQGRIVLRVERLVLPPDADPARYCHLRFEVQDSGVGITDREIGKIFGAFEQAGDARARAEGTGLGLAISQQIVEMMGGRLQVQSQTGEGSRFWFDVTLEQIGAAPTQAEVGQPVLGYEGPRRSVLVVSDQGAASHELTTILEPLGFLLRFAASDQDTFRLPGESRPDLILLDLPSSVPSHSRAIRIIRRVASLGQAPVIAISSGSVAIDQAARQWIDGVDILSRPVEESQLLALVQKHLHLTWLYQETRNGSGEKETPAAELCIPPQDKMAKFRELATQGSVWAVRDLATEVAARDARYAPFAQRVQELAAAFKDVELLAWLEGLSQRADP